jgi:hypothetical protein
MRRAINPSTTITRRKAMGVHYTPPLLAKFVADRLARLVKPLSSGGRLRVLDPACGDGVLLEALLRSLQEVGVDRCEVFGVEMHEEALTATRARLNQFAQARLQLIPEDFLNLSVGGKGQRELWASPPSVPDVDQPFDIVIANPPYVRTQVLGAERAQQLAARFGLAGRIDLYHAFLVAATVRVGIKTTADDVFIRSDWDTLPLNLRPEPELLHPLLRHEDACLWALPREIQPTARILYPHEVVDGCRRAIDLHHYPRAKAYLELHRERLQRRHYVVEAGRQWYEIWVPQDPQAWAAPKIVFPDISPEPRFYLDLEGRLVDGDCYWLTLDAGIAPDTLYLLLGVANSSVMSRFHDLAFNNKLYSARRRYITQYVSKYPYPDPGLPASRKLVALVKQLVQDRRSSSTCLSSKEMETQINTLVEEAFSILDQRKSSTRGGMKKCEYESVTFAT